MIKFKKFLKNKQNTGNNQVASHFVDKYGEIGKLVREARLRKGISIKDLSDMSKIPESTINAIENNIKSLRPKYPFIRSILLKLEEYLSLSENSLTELTGKEKDYSRKDKKNYLIREFDFLNSWQGSLIYFLGLLLLLFTLNKYFISEIRVIEFKIINNEFLKK